MSLDLNGRVNTREESSADMDRLISCCMDLSQARCNAIIKKLNRPEQDTGSGRLRNSSKKPIDVALHS